ncbi:MAG: hypothetical protein H7Z41_06550 [Cytophagales bacterium]|nr:hypothetical protein [Armatimonadota bacterium]
MQEDDRTLEMYVPAAAEPPTLEAPNGASVHGSATATVQPPVAVGPPSAAGAPPTAPPAHPAARTGAKAYGGASTPGGSGNAPSGAPTAPGSAIPDSIGRQRPSPVLDPLSRMRTSRLAKWGLLGAILLFFAWLPFAPSRPSPAFDLALVTSATVFAAILATGLPRLVLPGMFGRWHEPVEAVRDWLLVGVATGFLYFGFIRVAFVTGIGPSSVTSTEEWLKWRLPLLLFASVLAVFAARILAIRRESLVSSGTGAAVAQVAVQALLISVLERPLERGLRTLVTSGNSSLAMILGLAALILFIGSVMIIFWAATADENLSNLKKRRTSGVVDGTNPVELTLTVVGGRESGKTVLLAGAFYEWSTQNLGNLRITPTPGGAVDPIGAMGTGGGSPAVSLEDVARELYINYQFPVGTVSSQNLPFDLSLGQDKVARFSFLDYPGGAIAGRVADSRVVNEFWERVDDTDGLILIADMSYVRRNRKDSDWLEVRNAYRTVMQRLVDRNGKRRVVPVAMVLTKCDEFVDPNTGLIDMAQLEAGLKEFQYDELETEWRKMNAERGPGFAEFTTWITSAITYSQPQKGPDGRPDPKRPFALGTPPPTITPTGCASPLLWMTSKVMRWNVTLFADLGTFLFGSSPEVRRRIEAVLETERIAEERAAKA